MKLHQLLGVLSLLIFNLEALFFPVEYSSANCLLVCEVLRGFIFIKDGEKKKEKRARSFQPTAQLQTEFWIMLIILLCTQEEILAYVPPPDIWTEDNSRTMGTKANLAVGEAGDNVFDPSFNA